MNSAVVEKYRGSTILCQWDEITYAGQSPKSLSGLLFKLTIEHLRSGVDVVSLTDSDDALTATIVEGDPATVRVSARIDTTGDEWVAGQPYQAELWVIDAALGNHPLDVFRIVLNPSITELETEE